MLALLTLVLHLPLLVDPAPMNAVESEARMVGMKVAEGLRPASELVDDTAPMMAWLYAIVGWIAGNSLVFPRVLSLLILLLEAVIIGNLFINRKAFPENTYIPSLLFIVGAFLSHDMLTLSPELVGSFFLLIGISFLFRELEFDRQRDEVTFNLGITLSLATLFFLPYVLFVIVTILVLVLYSRRDLRMILLLITGFLLPHAVQLVVYLMLDSADELLRYYYLHNLSWSIRWLVSIRSVLWLCSVPVFFLVLAFFAMGRESRFTKYQAQLLQVMFLWTLAGIGVMFWGGDFRPQRLVHLIPAFSFFVAHLFLLIRRKGLAEMAFWLLAIAAIAGNYLTRYSALNDYVTFEHLWLGENTHGDIRGKRVLVLDNEERLFQENTPATGLLNWSLSKEIFEHPEYYENITLVATQFDSDPPDVILDPSDYLRAFAARIPAIRNSYRRNGEFYYRINN
jgi:hypothetical protein